MQKIHCFIWIVVFFLSVCQVGRPSDEGLKETISRVSPWLVRINTIGGHEKVGSEFANEGTATGLLLDRDGFVLTSAFHFLHDPSSILLRFADGSKRAARKVATDRNRMITLLKVENLNSEFLSKPLETASKDSIELGSRCLAMGCALSDVEPNIAVGIVSGKDRIWGKAIQTDAAVGPNNYGGPLVDLHGKLFGLLVPLSMTSDELAAGAEMYDAGVGMAVPMEDIAQILPRLKEGKDLDPGTIGIGFHDNRTFIGEAVLDEVEPGSSADKAGIKPGDQIVELDGKPIKTAIELLVALHSHYAGDKVRATYRRGEQTQSVEVPIEKKKKADPKKKEGPKSSE